MFLLHSGKRLTTPLSPLGQLGQYLVDPEGSYLLIKCLRYSLGFILPNFQPGIPSPYVVNLEKMKLRSSAMTSPRNSSFFPQCHCNLKKGKNGSLEQVIAYKQTSVFPRKAFHSSFFTGNRLNCCLSTSSRHCLLKCSSLGPNSKVGLKMI